MNTLYKDNNGQIYNISPIQKPQEDWVKPTKKAGIKQTLIWNENRPEVELGGL